MHQPPWFDWPAFWLLFTVGLGAAAPRAALDGGPWWTMLLLGPPVAGLLAGAATGLRNRLVGAPARRTDRAR